MKKIQYIRWAFTGIMVWLGSTALTGCKPNYDTEFDAKYFEVLYKDRGTITMSADGGEKTLRIRTNIPTSKWVVQSNCEWITLTPTDNQVLVKVASYDDFGARKGNVHIAYGHNEYNILVEQTSAKKVVFEVIGLTDPKAFVKTLPASGGEVSVQVRSNAPITDIVIPDSCAWMKLKNKESLESGVMKYSFTVEPSENVRPRYASAYLYTSSDISKVASFSIKQNNIQYTQIPLTAAMISTNAQEPSEGPIANICDGNVGNYFHSKWSAGGASDDGKPHRLQFNLTTPINDLKIEYSSRPNGGGNGDVKRADIYISQTGGTDDSEWTKVGTMNFPLPGGRKAKTLSNERIKFSTPVKYIRFVPTARRNADPMPNNAFFDMGEIYFYTTGDTSSSSAE